MNRLAPISVDDGNLLLERGDTPPDAPAGLPIEAGSTSSDLAKWEKNPTLAIIRDRFEVYHTRERLNPFISMGVRFQRGLLGAVQLRVTEGAFAPEIRRAIGMSSDQESGRGLPTQSVPQLLVEMSRMIADGAYVGAPVWEQDPESTMYYPDRTVHRDPRTFHQAVYDEEGRFLGFIQQVQPGFLSSSSRAAFIPVSQVVYAVDNAGAGPVGVGRKRATQILDQIWMETWRQLKASVRRYALGLQQLCLDPDVPEWAQRQLESLAKTLFADVEGWNTTLTDAAGKVAAIFAHIRQVAVLPPGLSLKKIGPDFDPEPALKLASRCAHSILQVFGAGHLFLGSAGTGGTYNLGQTQSATEEAALRIDVMTAVRAINVGLIDPIYDYNTHIFGVVPSSKRAYLTFSGLDSAAKTARAEYLGKVFELLEAAQRVGTVDDVVAIRREAGLRPLDDAALQQMKARQSTNAALGAVQASTARLAELRRPRAQRRSTQESNTDAEA